MLSHGGYAHAEIISQGDYVQAKTNINIRFDNNLEGTRIGNFDDGTLAYRLFSCDNNWDLILYQDMIGYVCRDYLEYSDYSSDDVHEEYYDILYTTSNLNFRLGPSKDSPKIMTIPKNGELESIAKTNNNWYLVKYNGKIGYVSGDYVLSLCDTLKSAYPHIDINQLQIEKIVYATSNLNIRSNASQESNIITTLSKYESVKVLKEYDDWYFILYDGIVGFISKDYTKILENIFVIIDISDQCLYLYNDSDNLVLTNIVTGKNTTPTNIGLFKIRSKETNRYLVGSDYSSYVNYWMPFDGGIGMHDAMWRKKFGGTIYQKKGSHGCVNMPFEAAQKVYEKVNVGTKVLVHK